MVSRLLVEVGDSRVAASACSFKFSREFGCDGFGSFEPNLGDSLIEGLSELLDESNLALFFVI